MLFQRGQAAGDVQGVQVHRDVQRHTAQRGRASGGRSQADQAPRDPRQEAETPGQQGEDSIEAARKQDRAQLKSRQGHFQQDVLERQQEQEL